MTDAANGCRVWDAHPTPKASIKWAGTCFNGYAQGHGVLQWFVDGKLRGSDEGEFRDGKLYGRGIHTAPDGSRYEGDWRAGVPYGEGRYVASDGSVLEGIWSDGCFVNVRSGMSTGVSKDDCTLY